MKIVIESDKRAIARIKVSPGSIAVARGLEGPRHRLKGGGLSFHPSRSNLDHLENSIGPLEIDDRRIEEQAASALAPQRRLPPYHSLKEPYPHQADAIEKISPLPQWALFMEQGTGKTKVAIDKAGLLWTMGAITGVVVVAPLGVHAQWGRAQLNSHFDYETTFGIWPMKELHKELRPGDELKWFLINFDGLKTKKGSEICRDFIEEHGPRNILFIIDESHNIKNKNSQRWKAAKNIAKGVLYRGILTGTPMDKDLEDIWAQFYWLNPDLIGIHYITHFRSEFCILGGFTGREVVAHKNVDRFKEIIDPYVYRVTRQDIGILPPVHEDWTFDLHQTQKVEIRRLKQELLAEIDDKEIEVSHAASAVIKMQQISNGFIIDEDGKVTRLPVNPRLAALKEMIAALPDQPFIIWCRFKEDIQILKEWLKKDAVTYHGGTISKDRIVAIDRFTSGDAKYFISNPQAGGTGLDGLQKRTNRDIYYSNQESYIQRVQSEARIDRIGSGGAAIHTDLIARGGVDRKILRNLRDKKSFTEQTLGDLRQWLAEDLEGLWD